MNIGLVCGGLLWILKQGVLRKPLFREGLIWDWEYIEPLLNPGGFETAAYLLSECPLSLMKIGLGWPRKKQQQGTLYQGEHSLLAPD